MQIDPAEACELLNRPVQVVAGKGGVGRSVIASALALQSARRGKRTLLLEINAPDNCARYLQVSPAPDEPREVLEHLWLCRMTPVGALREYALMVLKFKALYNFVFENPLVKYFLRSVPSLGEFTMMGKAWFHAEEKLPNGKPKYDRVIIDAPATGHAITLLSVSRVVADTVPKGIMKDAAQKMATLIEDEDRACLHVVATPEEMPVNEALQLAEIARDRLRMPPGLAILNRVLPPMLEDGEAEIINRLQAHRDDSVAPYMRAVQRHLDWEAWQHHCTERFEDGSHMPLLSIRELGSGAMDRAGLESIVAVLDDAIGDAGPAEGRSPEQSDG